MSNFYRFLSPALRVISIPRAAKADAGADAESENLMVYPNFDEIIISPWLFVINEFCKDYDHVEMTH